MTVFRSIVRLAAVCLTAAGLAAAEPGTQPLRLVAHRGENREAPENTIPAFELAWKNPAVWAVETDLCLTKDGKVVCFHGPMKKIVGRDDSIWKMSFEEVRQLDVGKWKGEKFAGLRMPTLTETLKSMPPGRHIFLELKIPANEAFFREFDLALRETGVKPEQITFISFNRKSLRDLHKRLPEYRRLWLCSVHQKDGKPTISHDELLAIMKEDELTGLDLGVWWKPEFFDSYATKEFIRRIHDAGGEAHFFTINYPNMAKKLYERGADSLTTDCSALIYDSLKKPSGK